MKLRELTAYLEELAPRSLQESYDNSGLQVGDPGMELSGILVALDVSKAVLLEGLQPGGLASPGDLRGTQIHHRP